MAKLQHLILNLWFSWWHAFWCRTQVFGSFFIVVNARKRSLGQGNILTSVCHSFCPQYAFRSHDQGVCLQGEGSGSGGFCIQGGSGSSGGLHGGGKTPSWILRDTVNEWAVRILLECILVLFCFCKIKFINFFPVGAFIFSGLCVIGSSTFAAGALLKGTKYMLPLMLLGRLIFGSGNGSLTSECCVLFSNVLVKTWPWLVVSAQNC